MNYIPPPWPSGLRAWDSLFTMKHGVWEVVGLIPASMADWTKGLGLLVHKEAWCAGGCGFDPQPLQYTRRVFHPARLPGKAFSVNMSLNFKF